MTELTLESDRRIHLPDELLARHGFHPSTPIRVIETRHGLLLVPLTAGPPSAELADWEALGLESWDRFLDEGPDS